MRSPWPFTGLTSWDQFYGRPNRAGVTDGDDDQLSFKRRWHKQSRPPNHVLKTWALARPRIEKTSDTDGRHRGADKLVGNGRLLIINVRNRKDSSTKYRRNSTW